MAGNVLKKETTEASRQTILCSPPNSIDYSSRAGASFFHLQKRGAEHLADGRGNKVPARSRTLGEEKITRREFRMMDDVLGKDEENESGVQTTLSWPGKEETALRKRRLREKRSIRTHTEWPRTR